MWLSVAVGSRLEDVSPHPPADPFAIAAGIVRGRITWPVTSTWFAAVLVALNAAAVIGVLALRRCGGKRLPLDRAARYVATAR